MKTIEIDQDKLVGHVVNLCPYKLNLNKPLRI